MKEKIYTIPINDAFDANGECPVCTFLKKEEADRVEYALGDSMMQPEERIVSNEKGYCNRHTEMMYKFGNKLSHALVLETRLDYLIGVVDKTAKEIPKPKKAVFGKAKYSDEICDALKAAEDSVSKCVICERLDKIIEIFTDNLFYMYKNDSAFKEKLFSSKGFCMNHFLLLAKNAPGVLSPNEAHEFISKLCLLQRENVSRVREDVSWFTKKFDYRFKDEDWKNSRDAVPRGCEKTASYMCADNDNQ